MMKILYYDCFSGISGDMHLAAMIELGVPENYLIDELAKLKLDEFKLNIRKANRKGIQGTLVDVIVSTPHSGLPSQGMTITGKSVSGRNFIDIKKLILASDLNKEVKDLSIAIFERIAIAEGKIHALPKEKVHFHEVGAVDSIVDIVGAAICIDYFKPDKIMAAPPELGSGMVNCQHGVFPVPAPATLEILSGIPVRTGGVNHEATTPTGAAILATVVSEFTYKTNFIVLKAAYGIGFRDTDKVPNVLRVILAEQNDKHLQEQAVMIECNIDDMNPEFYDYVISKLFELGADDVFLTPIIMKKSRPGTTISILSKPGLADNLIHFILEETTTLGIRKYNVEKKMLQRQIVNLQTPWGAVRVKNALDNGRVIKSKPEYEDCLKIARENNLPLRKIMDKIEELIRINFENMPHKSENSPESRV